MPEAEAHGGYAFCALAALEMLGQSQLLDHPRLEVVCLFAGVMVSEAFFFLVQQHWAAHRQMRLEGGFQVCFNKHSLFN